MNRGLPCALFLVLWAFHLTSAGGALVPYRDTGEMVSNAWTLGVAHPPGYPLYTLLGKAASVLPFGGPSFKVNLLSALGAALTGTALFLLLRGAVPAAAAALAAAFLAGSPYFRELGAVSEMYSWSFCGLAVVFLLAWRTIERDDPRSWPALAFLVGAACGVRTDFVLLFPALLYLFWRRGRGAWILPCLLLFVLGMSVFLYLPFRSARQPWIDWNNPEELSRLVASLLRRTHGGTLDLLSKSYAPGENFLSEMALYLKGTASGFTWAGAALALLGAGALWRKSKVYSVFLLIVFAVNAPLFIYLANMPPNPHAVAIVEAHYVPSHMVLCVLIGFGAGAVLSKPGPFGRALAAAALAVFAGANVLAHEPRASKRWNLALRDYVANVSRSSAPGSVGVLREDVQLFSFWEASLVSRLRPDMTVVAQGLAASPWYHDMMRGQGRAVPLTGLREEADWAALRERLGSSPLWAGGDANLSWRGETRARGLLIYLGGEGAPPENAHPAEAFYVHRGTRDQAKAPDFFSSDLLTEYSKGALREASVLLRERDWPAAREKLLLARSFDSESPSVPFNLGYVELQRNDLDASARAYARASLLCEEMLRRAEYFKSLPDVVDGLRQEASEVWVHRGVLAERRGNIDDARNCYAQALRLDPRSTQAHYNWAVTYWNRDWPKAAEHFEAVLAISPGHEQARAFLEKARSAMRASKS